MTTTTYDAAALKAELVRDEGSRNLIYKDTRGFLTVGIGHNCSIEQNAFTIDALYQNDINGCEASLDMRFPWWRKLDPVRQRVMVGAMFNLGGAKLATFTTFLTLMEAGKYAQAGADLLTTLWAKQVGARATRYAYMVEHGTVPPGDA